MKSLSRVKETNQRLLIETTFERMANFHSYEGCLLCKEIVSQKLNINFTFPYLFLKFTFTHILFLKFTFTYILFSKFTFLLIFCFLISFNSYFVS
jgi:hypothetical protein